MPIPQRDYVIAIGNQFPLGNEPAQAISFKSNAMSSSTAIVRLRHMKPANCGAGYPQGNGIIDCNASDQIRIITPGIMAQIRVLNSVMPGGSSNTDIAAVNQRNLSGWRHHIHRQGRHKSQRLGLLNPTEHCKRTARLEQRHHCQRIGVSAPGGERYHLISSSQRLINERCQPILTNHANPILRFAS